MLMAAAFLGGYLLAAAPAAGEGRIRKAGWGLVAGGRSAVAPVTWTELSSLDAADQMAVARHLVAAGEGPWLFTGEADGGVEAFCVDPLREVVGARRLTWGAVLGEAGEDPALVKDTFLVLQEGFDRSADPDYRLAGVLRAFAWAAGSSESLGRDVEVGLHEVGGRFSVDRVSWRAQGRGGSVG